MNVPDRMTRPLAMLAALLLVSGCGDTGGPGAGLTNGPSPNLAGEKPADRTDMAPPVVPDRGEILGEVGDDTNDAGTGGRGSGQQGSPNPPAGGSASGDQATPEAVEAPSANSDSGSTGAADHVNAGTPRGPQ